MYKLQFFLSYPKSLIGYPESVEKTGFQLNRPAYRQAGYGNDGLKFDFIHRLYIDMFNI
jgi:hypothetical protein